MRKMLRKTMTLALSAVLAMQVFAVGASAELFIDNPVVKDGKTSVKVANYTNKAQKVRLYTANYEGETLKDVDASELVEVAAGGSVELTTDITGESFIWSDALVPYDENAVALAAPENLTAPASRDSASNHRTWAYNSFLLEWDLDTTGVVDHYEVYANGTKIGETENGYYIVYVDDVNEASKSYSVKAVTVGGKTSDVSTSVEAGTLYMNEIDFTDMTGIEAETNLSVTYPNYSNASYTADAPKYATTEDVKETAKWIGAREKTPSYGIKAVGMSVFTGEWGTDQYAAPAYVAADETVGREARGAIKTYYANKTSSSNDAGANPYIYFALNNDYLKINNEQQGNVTLAYDYLDNGTGNLYGRTAEKSTTGYFGNDISAKGNTNKWKTNERPITDYNEVVDTRWNIGNSFANTRIYTTTVPTGATGEKLYISGARAWLTDRMTTALDNNSKIQMAKAEYNNAEAGNKVEVGMSTEDVSGGTQQRNGTYGVDVGCCWMTKRVETNEIGFNVDDTYLGKYDNNVAVSVNFKCAGYGITEPTKMVLTYEKSDGTIGTVEKELVYDKWDTVTFKLSDAGFANGVSTKNCDFTIKLNGGFDDNGKNGPQLYVDNIRVHASNNVK